MSIRIGYALCIVLGVLMAFTYADVLAACGESCASQHQGIIDGTIYSPHRYRVLSAFIVEALPGGVLAGYVLLHAFVLPAMLALLLRWLARFTTTERALIGVLLLAAYWQLLTKVYGISVYAPLELAILCLGLLWLSRR